MHIEKITIRNIKSIRNLSWSIPKTRAAGWHVVLGDNGSGKSALLKAVALALVGPREAERLRQPWDDWLSHGKDKGSIELQIGWDPEQDHFQSKGRTPSSGNVQLGLEILRNPDHPEAVTLEATQSSPSPDSQVWSGSTGWFAASYGPFRRFTGSDAGTEKAFYSMPRLARHLSLFEERVALTECVEWLQSLKFRSLEGDPEGALLGHIVQFVNQGGFLPSGVRLEEVTSKAVLFRDAAGVLVAVDALSDGYRSVMSMTFELIRQMAITFGPDGVFDTDNPEVVKASGVVLIDEIDAHLHPTWQKRIGRWLCEHFPKVQFIVSTHSPLVCQSAEKGSIYLLPRAGSGDKGKMLEGELLKRLIYGNVLDAYGTEAFGAEAAMTRSPESRQRRDRLALLNNKELLEGLSEREREEQDQLRAELPSVASSLE